MLMAMLHNGSWFIAITLYLTYIMDFKLSLCLPPFRDEILSQYSPMSEDSDDFRCYDTQLNPNMSHTDSMGGPSTSPMSSPHRHQKPQSALLPSNPYPLPSCSLSSVVCSHARRGTDNEGRFPSSPNDMCHGADLRRTALLRSVQMRVQGPHAYDVSFRQEQEHAHEHEHEHLEGLEEAERQPSCRKSIDDEVGFRRPDHDFCQSEHDIDYVGNCPSDDCPDPTFKQDDKNHCKFDSIMDKSR